MRNLKRALAALFVLLLAAVVLFFVLENQQPVALILFGWRPRRCRWQYLYWLLWSSAWRLARCSAPTVYSAASARFAHPRVRLSSAAIDEISYGFLGKSHLCTSRSKWSNSRFIFGPGERAPV
jgi:hypothetical protein